MIDSLLNACNTRFQNERHRKTCPNCTYSGHCPNQICECERCLELVHFPTRVPAGAPPRKYDCTHMADFYVCKYACKYSSELVYAFERLRDLTGKDHIKVLSFGCGPCTDLLALDFLRTSGVYHYSTIEYRGVDYGQDVWSSIHADLKSLVTHELDIKFFYEDAKELINTIAGGTWVPDLVVFQYFFSDMAKNSAAADITAFISTFARYTNAKMNSGSYIVLNDINLSIRWQGGREYFDRLSNQLHNVESHRVHFNNDRPGHGTYQYGSGSDGEYADNNLKFSIGQVDGYNPFRRCGSAQMIIKRGK